jgi:DNA repair protein RadC
LTSFEKCGLFPASKLSIGVWLGEKTEKTKSIKKDDRDTGWWHPGGKLIEMGADKLSDAELLSIIIAPGVKGISAEKIANNILNKFGSYRGMANQPLERFLEFKGMGDTKVIRLAAVFEMATRIVNEVLKDHEKEE